ncbi:MAG: DUF302 domain-containing protein [Roseobacter sp.]|jgi:uncharacterized protein (DUF302 family)|nr:DUF302 domain-containing protein [Roseobacter sp.]
MLRPLAFAVSLLFVAVPIVQAADLVEKTSPYPVSETIDRLIAAVEGAGATVFARVDHGAGAGSVGLELAPAELLIFGNPKLGTPAMQDGITAGLDLPLRVLAYADNEGVVRVVYHAPADLATDHGLPGDAKYIQMMTGALDKLTSKAVAAD